MHYAHTHLMIREGPKRSCQCHRTPFVLRATGSDVLALGEHPRLRMSRMSDRYGGAMECDDYQRAALRTARDKDAPNEFMHLVLGLVG